MHVQVVLEGKTWPDVLHTRCPNPFKSAMGINGQRCPCFLDCGKKGIKVFFNCYCLTLRPTSQGLSCFLETPVIGSSIPGRHRQAEGRWFYMHGRMHCDWSVILQQGDRFYSTLIKNSLAAQYSVEKAHRGWRGVARL